MLCTPLGRSRRAAPLVCGSLRASLAARCARFALALSVLELDAEALDVGREPRAQGADLEAPLLRRIAVRAELALRLRGEVALHPLRVLGAEAAPHARV